MADQDTPKELNRLYWESDASISEIADRLDISRRALYDGIEPLPAGRPCPECGGALGFRNRTAAENREAECPECGLKTELADDGAAGNGGTPDSAADEPRSEADRRPIAGPDEGSGPVLGGAFVSGLAMGALVTYLLRRR